MKAILLPAVLCVALGSALAVQPADAKGCIKGAVVGGVAGHLAHHGILGAMAGCAVGHHMAAKHAREARQNATSGTGAGSSGDYNNNR